MSSRYDYDVVVIGAGIAGMVSAVTARGLGKRVAVVEKRKVGGNCTNFTCIPSKTLIRLSHVRREISHLIHAGILAHQAGLVNGSNVMDRIRSVVQTAYEKDVPETFEQIGITMLEGSASFVDRHHIQVNGHSISSEYFILAVGTRPFIPPIEGISDVNYLTNETLYELEDLPKSLIILGGGVDGLEYGCAFGGLGVETTVVELGSKILPMVDREIAGHLQKILVQDGIRLMTGTKATSLRDHEGRAVLTFERGNGVTGEVEAEHVLVALGRRPDLDGLELDKAGVNFTPKGITTDQTLRTSASNIYACGDIAGPDQLASMAEYQGIVAATNAVTPVKQKVNYSNSVYVIFTVPTLAFFGLTEAQAHAKYGHKLSVYRFDYGNMRRALIDGTSNGMAKFLCDGRGRLVGAHILGEAAAEVIHEAQAIKAMKKPLYKMHKVTHAYPTYAQALVGRSAQLAFLEKMGGSFFVNAALKMYPGLSNNLHVARERLAETGHAESTAKTGVMHVVLDQEEKGSSEWVLKATYRDREACIVDLPDTIMDFDHRFIESAFAWNGFQDPKYLVLDFGRVQRINGLGACMLVKLAARSRIAGRRLVAFGVGADLREVFKVTDLEKVIESHESEEKALAALGLASKDLHTTFESRPPDALVNVSNWAKPVSELLVPPMPQEARNLNVNGRRAVGPVNGFGPLWQKVFCLVIPQSPATPETAIAMLKENFPRYQPSFNRFYASQRGISAGEIVLIDSSTPGGPVSTGVMVLYSDERSFTFNTPQGHPECGFVSFSSQEQEGGIVVQIVGLARAGDPLYETAFRFLGSKIQTRIWKHVLTSLALDLGVQPMISAHQECIDRTIRWREMKNFYYNAQLRTLVHEPKRWLGYKS
jgi:pyruvate/2-oxoglutarate dehydrogenase complex dihydrolipoamide dehydrogenase (E3) component/anti-anti-sigma regulatory factor